MSTTSVNKLSQLISTAVASYAIHLNKNDLKGTLTNMADFANFISTQADQFVKQYDSGDQFQNVAFNGFSAIYASKVPFA